MPTAYVEGPALSPEKKKQLGVEITDVLERVYGLPRNVYVVIVRENPPENVCVGGKMVSEMRGENR